VAIFELLRAAPRRVNAPIAAAVGMAAGFYPRPSPSTAILAAACAFAGVGLALRGLGRAAGGGDASRESRGFVDGLAIWSLLALACSVGLVAGLAAARDDAARALFAAAPLFAAEGEPERPAPLAAARGAAARQARVRLAAVEGRLASDSSPAKGGFRSYLVTVSRIAVSGRALSGSLGFRGRPPGALRALARGGPALDAGARIEVVGRTAKGGGALFASPGGIRALDLGGRADRARGAARSACRAALARVGRRSSGLLEALILGARDNLDAEEAEAFKAAGCSHVLALSGQHLSVLALLVVAALAPLAGPRRARLGAALVAAAFMWLAGSGPSLLRAVLMAFLGAIASALDRPQEWLGLLALSFLLALPADPEAARSLGFLLSYLAVWGLAVLAPRFRFLLEPVLPPALSAAVAASLGAQAATSPLLACSFGSLQLMGILASTLSAPLVTALMWWGMGAAAFCSLVPGAAVAAAVVSDFLRDLLVGVMRAAASVPPIALPSVLERAAASAAAAIVAGIVYAYPWLAYKKQRFPPC